jgi:protein arginine kinase
VLSAVQEMKLVVRGGQGEGSDITGSLFQVSNQATLGVTEEDTVVQVERQARKIARFEVEAREQLMKESPAMIEDKVFRALAALRSARMISSKEVMEHLSALRLGISLELVSDVTYGRIHELMVSTRPAHLQKRMGGPMDSQERDIARAEVIRASLN